MKSKLKIGHRFPTCYFNNAEVIAFPEASNVPLKTDAKWWEIKNQTAQAADIYLYDEISPYGCNAKDLVTALRNLKDAELNVHINSPGGSVFEGMAIYNALARHEKTVTVHVDGLAASIASVIMLAGKVIKMADNAMVMIHDPSAITWGRAKDLRKQADVLDQIKETIINVYAARTGKKRETLAKLMDEETWFTAKEAASDKFVDEVVKPLKAAAKFDLKKFEFANTAAYDAIKPLQLTQDAPAPTNSAPTEQKLITPRSILSRKLALHEVSVK